MNKTTKEIIKGIFSLLWDITKIWLIIWAIMLSYGLIVGLF